MIPLPDRLIGYDDVRALDLVGPAHAFRTANGLPGNGVAGKRYQVILLGLIQQPFRSESGSGFDPDTVLGAAPALDTVIVSGGRSCERAFQRRFGIKPGNYRSRFHAAGRLRSTFSTDESNH